MFSEYVLTKIKDKIYKHLKFERPCQDAHTWYELFVMVDTHHPILYIKNQNASFKNSKGAR